MICQICGYFVSAITDKQLSKGTVRLRRYVCINCSHHGEQWDTLQKGVERSKKNPPTHPIIFFGA